MHPSQPRAQPVNLWKRWRRRPLLFLSALLLFLLFQQTLKSWRQPARPSRLTVSARGAIDHDYGHASTNDQTERPHNPAHKMGNLGNKSANLPYLVPTTHARVRNSKLRPFWAKT